MGHQGQGDHIQTSERPTKFVQKKPQRGGKDGKDLHSTASFGHTIITLHSVSNQKVVGFVVNKNAKTQQETQNRSLELLLNQQQTHQLQQFEVDRNRVDFNSFL